MFVLCACHQKVPFQSTCVASTNTISINAAPSPCREDLRIYRNLVSAPKAQSCPKQRNKCMYTYNLFKINNEMTHNCKRKFKIKLFPAQTIMFSVCFAGWWQSHFECFMLLADCTPDRLHSHLKFPNKLEGPSVTGFFIFISSFGFGTRMTFPCLLSELAQIILPANVHCCEVHQSEGEGLEKKFAD